MASAALSTFGGSVNGYHTPPPVFYTPHPHAFRSTFVFATHAVVLLRVPVWSDESFLLRYGALLLAALSTGVFFRSFGIGVCQHDREKSDVRNNPRMSRVYI